MVKRPRLNQTIQIYSQLIAEVNESLTVFPGNTASVRPRVLHDDNHALEERHPAREALEPDQLACAEVHRLRAPQATRRLAPGVFLELERSGVDNHLRRLARKARALDVSPEHEARVRGEVETPFER